MDNVPQEPGLYFAKSNKDGWWDLIVNVQGESPMLYIDHIYSRGGASRPRIIVESPGYIAVWGKEIEEPE